jgi:hypothetical protein
MADRLEVTWFHYYRVVTRYLTIVRRIHGVIVI